MATLGAADRLRRSPGDDGRGGPSLVLAEPFALADAEELVGRLLGGAVAGGG